MAQKVLRYPYIPFSYNYPQSGKIRQIYRPIIPVMVSWGHRIGRPFGALVDSGSDRNLFPAELGESQGMKVKKGLLTPIGGIGQALVNAYSHRITIYIGGNRFETEADFSYEHKFPILGRNGFFNLFKSVNIKENEKIVQLVFK